MPDRRAHRPQRVPSRRSPGPGAGSARRATGAPPRDGLRRLPAWAAPATVVAGLLALVVWVFRPLLGAFFALDDFVLFQQVHGIRPWPASAWRFLSGVAWFRLVTPLWGESPLPYHVASLAIHALNAVLLWRLARRWGASAPAAFLAAGLFAAARQHYPALFAASSIGELLALTFTLAALLLPARGVRMLAALACFALALLAKESVLLVPAALLAVPAAGTRIGGAPGVAGSARAAAPLLALGLVGGGALLAAGVFSGRLAGQAYALGLGATLPLALARLLGWSLDLVRAIPDLHAGAAPTELALAGVAALALALLAWRWKSAPLVRAGLAWWLLAVLPVLPLAAHLYLHYLYTPLAGLALAVAGAFDAIARRFPRTRAAWPVAVALVVAHAALAATLVAQRAELRMPATDWPLDPVTRKSVIAQRAIESAANALAGRRGRIAILLPAGASQVVDLGTGAVVAGKTAARQEIQEVLDDGRSLRAFLPNADSVEFQRGFIPGHEDFDLFGARADGVLVDFGRPPRGHAIMSVNLSRVGRWSEALEWADSALVHWPSDASLYYARAMALERGGRHADALHALADLVRIAPDDSLATQARAALAREPVAAH